jgi:DNA-binding response OmpR family regulator
MTIQERPTVLLVEDDRATREMFSYALRVAGFSVSVAGDGFTALRLIEEQLPDVVVLDLDLPHLSGVDVHQEIVAHAETRVIPVIIVTGTEWKVRAAVFRTLHKPVIPDVLVRVVQQAVSPSSEPPDGERRRRT